MRLYADGTERSTADVSGLTITETDPLVLLPGSGATGAWMSEAAIWRRELSAAEVALLP